MLLVMLGLYSCNHLYNYHVCFVLSGSDNFMHKRLGSSTWAKRTSERDLSFLS